MENEKSRKLLKVCAVVCAAAGVLSLVIFIPQVRELIISFGEKYVGRPLTHEVWHRRFIGWELAFLLTMVLPIMLFSSLAFNVRFLPERLPFFRRLHFDRKYIVAVALCFAFISGIRFYWMSQKTGFHEDELWEIGICNFNDMDKDGIGFWGSLPEKDRAYSGLEIKEKVFFNNPSVLDMLKDEARLWLYNRDSAHTSLYYMLFRLWFVGAKTHGFHRIFIRGILLNYVFFCISFLLMLHLLKILSAGRVASIFLLLMAFCNPASVGISIFLREYALQEMGLILFSVVFVRYLRLFADGTSEFDKAFWLKTAVITAVAMSTGYYTIMFVGLAGLVIIINRSRVKDWNSVRYFLLVFAAALLISRLFYLLFGSGLFVGRGTEALSKLNHGAVKSLGNAVINTISIISKNFISFYALLAVFVSNIVLCALSKKKGVSTDGVGVLLFFLAFAWALVTIFFAPYKTLRYVAPAFCLFPAIFIPCARTNRAALVALALQIAATAFVCARTLPLERNAVNIEHIDDSNKSAANPEYNKHPDVPVFIQRGCVRAYIYPYLNDSQTYYFVDEEDEIFQYGLSDCFYINFISGEGFSEKRLAAENLE